MPADKIDTLLARHARAWRVRDDWRALLEDAYRYFLPNRNLYHNEGSNKQGDKKADVVFDSVGQTSLINFANRIQSDMLPPGQRWAELVAGPFVPEDLQDDLNTKLEDVTKRAFAVIHASNFDTAIGEVLLDLGISTGAMLILEGDAIHPVNYVPVPLHQIALEEGPWGSVDGVHRRHKICADNILGQWPDAKLNDTLRELADKPPSGDDQDKIELIEITYLDRKVFHEEQRSIWYYDVIHKASKHRLVSRTYETFSPWVTPRWIKVAGEVFGRGPAIQALPDMKTASKVVELTLKAAALHIMGVWAGVDDGTLNPNTVKIVPGAVIPVGSNGGARGPSLQRMDPPGRFDIGNVVLEDQRVQIKRFLLDDQLPPQTGSVRSATEIIERVKALARDIGSPFGRMKSELVVPLLQRTLKILERRGLVEKVTIDGLGVKVQVISPLAQQQNLDDVETVINWLQVMASFDPNYIAVNSKLEEVFAWIGENLGVPSSLIQPKQQRLAVVQQLGAAGAQAIASGAGGEQIGAAGQLQAA